VLAAEALPTVVPARSLVLPQPSATVGLVQQPAVALSTPLLDIVAAARVES
jgi:hypothetical protein